MWCVYRQCIHPIKNEISLFVSTGMDLKGIMLSEISQTEKDKDTSPVKSLKQKIISQNNLDMLVGIIAKNKNPKPKPKTTLANLCRNVC